MLSPLLFKIELEVLAEVIIKKEQSKNSMGNEEVKHSLFTDDMIIYIEEPRDSIQRLLELNKSLVEWQGTK